MKLFVLLFIFKVQIFFKKRKQPEFVSHLPFNQFGRIILDQFVGKNNTNNPKFLG